MRNSRPDTSAKKRSTGNVNRCSSKCINGQVTFEELVSALSARFKSVHLLWSSSNFCEFVASDDPEKVKQFVELLGPVVQPSGFCFEAVRLGDLGTMLSGDKALVDA